ncbi:MAG: hypothetical protein Q4E75_04030 [bacterium]|nr:hypothetical protein [bacterium]
MKKYIIAISLALLFIIFYIVYRVVTNYNITLNIKEDSIKVNLYDEIDVGSYLISAYDNKKNDLKDKVIISVEIGDNDLFENNKLFVNDIDTKVIKYTLESKNVVVEKKLIINVIIDPNDPEFKPNYDKIIDNSSNETSDEVPEIIENSDLNSRQIEYLNSLRNK